AANRQLVTGTGHPHHEARVFLREVGQVQEEQLPSPALPGLPGSSTDLSLRAVPNHPGRPDGCLLVASPPVSGFTTFGRLATSPSVTRPNRVRLRYGSQGCVAGFHQVDRSPSLRFRYMYERDDLVFHSF